MTLQVLVATRNAGKSREIRAMLAEAPVMLMFLADAHVPETRAEEHLEDGETFEANARRKAEYFAYLTGLPTLAEDSGIEVFSLGGAPGIHSRRFARFGGPPRDQDAANNAELLRRLAGLPMEKRRARYRCVVAYLARPDAVSYTFEGTCTGAILEEPRGTGGFGYDPLFLSDDLNQSFGDASASAKDAVSHRGRAFRAFAEWLQRHPG